MTNIDLILGILITFLGILLVIEVIQRTNFKKEQFTYGLYQYIVGAILLAIFGLYYIFKSL